MEPLPTCVGIISDSHLLQHQIQTVLAQAGYRITVNARPGFVNEKQLSDDRISVWIVDIIDENSDDDYLDFLMEHAGAPVFFGEGTSLDRNSEEFPGWQRRLLSKLTKMAPPIRVAQEIAEPAKEIPKPKFVQSLPDSLKAVSKTLQVHDIWILGASLGGPEPVKLFLDAMPAGVPAAFLYAQHIAPTSLASLTRTIGRHSKLEFAPVTHGCKLQNSQVLVVPVENEIRFFENSSIEVRASGWNGMYGPTIDHLVENAVNCFGPRVNLMLFSGMGNDGARGVRLVHEAGGKVWCQDADSAIMASMPDAAYATGLVDYRGPPDALAYHLVNELAIKYKRANAAE